MSGPFVRHLLMVSVSACALAGAYDADAQETEVGEVLVTASRADVSGFAAATPTTVFSAETLAKQGVTNVSQIINQNPAFRSSNSPSGNGAKGAAPGQSSPDLRGLGPSRTLVLVNGLRVPPLAPITFTGLGTGTTTDLNIIPSIMIDRMEIVTGGASAQWGSDAVAGVLNVILKNEFDGLRVSAQAGQSERGDAEKGSLGILGGTEFADGRGQLVAAGEYERSAGLGDYRTRDYLSDRYALISNPARATNGLEANLLVPYVASALSTGGLISGPANFSLRNYTFNSDGSVRPYNNGSLVSGQFAVGGEGPAPYTGSRLIPAFHRYTFYSRASYDLTNSLTAAVELSYTKLVGGQPGGAPRLTATTIRSDNPYLPANVRAALAAQNLTSFTFTRYALDLGLIDNDFTSKTPHLAVSLKGKVFGDWSWDANYGYGENRYDQNITNSSVNGVKRDSTGAIVFDNRRYEWAADAVVNPATGQIVCRATLPGPGFIAAAAGCVPANFFGEGNVSAQAKAYLNQSAWAKVKYVQQHATLNLRGRPFETWAGPVSIGTGVEFRREKEDARVSELSAQSGFVAVGNAGPFKGKFSTKEAYLDSIIPLARDVTLAKSLDITASGRVSDYSNVGTLWAWKLGANYEPIDGLRLRITKSKDIRAPSLYQLYGDGQWIDSGLNIAGVNYISFPQNVTAGNPNLDAEIGKTLTIGGVLEPRFLPGFRVSVDYFNIKIGNAITSLNAVTVANLCTRGDAFFCGLFTRNAAGVPVSLLTGAQNLAKNEVEGYEFAVNYSRNLSELIDGGPDATLNLSMLGTYISHSIIDSGALGGARVDRAGENSEFNAGALPRLRIEFMQSISFDKLTVTARERFISSGLIDKTYNLTAASTVNTNYVPKVIYMDLYANYQVNDKFQVFAAVDNVFDKAPPPTGYPNFTVPAVNGQYYDKVQRAYRVGLTYDF